MQQRPLVLVVRLWRCANRLVYEVRSADSAERRYFMQAHGLLEHLEAIGREPRARSEGTGDDGDALT